MADADFWKKGSTPIGDPAPANNLPLAATDTPTSPTATPAKNFWEVGSAPVAPAGGSIRSMTVQLDAPPETPPAPVTPEQEQKTRQERDRFADVPSNIPVQKDYYANYLPPPPIYAPLVQAAADHYKIPYDVLAWVGAHESGWNSDAMGIDTSSGRAKGMFQFKDATAKMLGIDPMDPRQAIDGGARYLRQLFDKTGDWTKAIEAYGTFSTGLGKSHDAEARNGFDKFMGGVTARRDAGNVFPEEQPGRYYGTLPFSEDEETGKVTWGLEQSSVGRALARGIQGFESRLSGPLTPDKLHGLNADEQTAFLTLGGMPQPTGRNFISAAERAAPDIDLYNQQMRDWTKGATISPAEERAANILSKRANQDVKASADPSSSGNPAQDIIDRVKRMRESGKAGVVADVAGPNSRGILGTVARTPGTSKAVVSNFLVNRDAGASDRLLADVNRYLNDGPSVYTSTKDILDTRSAEGKPLYKAAFAGGSMAPLEQQFAETFNGLSRAEKEANQAVEVAKSQLNAALAKMPVTGGNVYSENAARQAVRETQAAVRAAEAQRDAVAAQKQEATRWLRRSQADIANNTPGAVWNPRIQEFLDLPDVRKGLRRGFHIQRNEAVAENVPFNPTEYALSPDGEVIRVPNMRTLNVAKKGLDAMIRDERDQYGRLSEAGVALDKLRRSFLKELDALNPDYAAARGNWAEHSQALDAIQWGKNLERISPEQVASEFAEMTKSEKEFARIGAADTLRERLLKTRTSADEAKRIVTDEWAKGQLKPLFRSPEEFQQFMDAVEDERAMYATRQGTLGGSQTAERGAEDSQPLSAASEGVHAVRNLAEGRMMRAMSSGLRAARHWREFGLRNREDLNEWIARMGVDQSSLPEVQGNRLNFRPGVGSRPVPPPPGAPGTP